MENKKKIFARYGDFLIVMLLFIAPGIGCFFGGIVLKILGFALIISSVALFAALIQRGKQDTCESCRKFRSVRKEKYSTGKMIGKTHSYSTETKSEQVGYVCQYGSLLPDANIYATRKIEHKDTTYHQEYSGYCICCGHKQPFYTSSTVRDY